MAKVVVKVVEGACQGGYHNLGDTFEIDCRDALTPEGMCLGAWGSVFPYVMVLLGDGEFYWSDDRKRTRVSCADPKGIILEVSRQE
jgi:uncharacterized repeat protein (TIGR04076 family)